MNVQALAIYIGKQRVGVLFQYRMQGADVVTRFVADDAFARRTEAPVISAAYLAASPEDQAAFWADVRSEPLNGRYSPQNGWLLPAFFQNLLPEGVFRDHVARVRGCDPRDHFEMLAACGGDLPGNVYARPVELSRNELAQYVTQNQDALEMTVTADPMEEGVSLSGVQPKLGVIKEGQRYVGRTREHDTHIIAKLPVVGQPLLPELEALSLQLAEAAGVQICQAYLEPLENLVAEHGYDLGDADACTQFLAVVRYDREPGRRIHCEDFAQVLGAMPEQKYQAASYLDVAAVMMAFPSLGEPAVHELLRRMTVNEMLGNPDMHLKNLGLIYHDGITPTLAPAYDIVAYSAYHPCQGHALRILPPALAPRRNATGKPSLSPAVLRAFCAQLRIPEKPAAKAVSDCVKAAHAQWPLMIEASTLTERQRKNLLTHFQAHPMVKSVR
ncbi:type II toxin-antitoxin system HipA family toxin [Bordetella sp. 02P26C-1]|uniref:type II toxin-antitoxin system HipA family toxin n=1 Tax=Bordetella sp. 02P26C-1 TaxID=2683195 RepID=UPI001354C10B|nr:type II toxin-antitoxin system HipA family toxin [Bordetella sp. 02P26C-1]MVW80560.1 type II toxin-antitoxin system HipA family toxin [Bordetella sp. 02P26C-1]